MTDELESDSEEDIVQKFMGEARRSPFLDNDDLYDDGEEQAEQEEEEEEEEFMGEIPQEAGAENTEGFIDNVRS